MRIYEINARDRSVVDNFFRVVIRPQIVLDCPRLPFLCQKGDGGRGNDVNISQIMRIFVQLRIRVRA